ncbi:hypothetical protein PIB30_103992, partial [Stylosanthes scabra]|nr:hypothetical protein [Stylosanthes scabra]
MFEEVRWWWLVTVMLMRPLPSSLCSAKAASFSCCIRSLILDPCHFAAPSQPHTLPGSRLAVLPCSLLGRTIVLTSSLCS